MAENSVGVRELKARLSRYLKEVEAGATLLITDRGRPIGRIVPIRRAVRDRVQELQSAGLVKWSGRSLEAPPVRVRVRGDRTVAELLVDGRG